MKSTRATGLWPVASKMVAACAAVLISLVAAPAAMAEPKRVHAGGSAYVEPVPERAPAGRAVLSADGRRAIAPAGAPRAVKAAIAAANRIVGKPYRYGGGHGNFADSGYDCSGTVSFALRGGRLLSTPLDSSSFMSWGEGGVGRWITVYTNPGHAYAVIAGLRLDTSGPGERGPRWRPEPRSSKGFVARHPRGL